MGPALNPESDLLTGFPADDLRIGVGRQIDENPSNFFLFSESNDSFHILSRDMGHV